MIWRFRFVVLCILMSSLYACGQPSDVEVMQHIDAAWRGFQSVNFMNEETMKRFAYDETLQDSFNNENYTVIQDIDCSLDKDNGILSIAGTCKFNSYKEPQSKLVINGAIQYAMTGNIFQENPDVTFDIDFDTQYKKSKVKSVSFKLGQENIRNRVLPPLSVNGKEYVMDRDKAGNVMNIFNKGVSIFK